MKKILTIVLTLMMLILPSVSYAALLDENQTIYVDDDGGADYTNIQDAIDAADEGDQIYVSSGTYDENIQIDKGITITGEDKSNTIIDGNGIGNVVDVTADSVTFNGFTVRNSEVWSAGIYVYDSEDVLISDCIVTSNNGHGIELDLTRQVTVSNCEISSNMQFGIVILPSNGHRPASNHNIVSNCIISDNDEGVYLDDTTGNTIIENQIMDNHIYGVHLDFCEGNVIERNNIFDNEVNAYFNGIWGNTWSNNYWGKIINIGVKIIIGKIIVLPWLNFDMDPASEPFDLN